MFYNVTSHLHVSTNTSREKSMDDFLKPNLFQCRFLKPLHYQEGNNTSGSTGIFQTNIHYQHMLVCKSFRTGYKCCQKANDQTYKYIEWYWTGRDVILKPISHLENNSILIVVKVITEQSIPCLKRYCVPQIIYSDQNKPKPRSHLICHMVCHSWQKKTP